MTALSRALDAHRKGAATIMSGADVVSLIDRELKDDPRATAVAMHLTCPPSLDLTNEKRGICTAEIAGANQPRRLWVWIDDHVGLRVLPIDAMVDRSEIGRRAQEDLNRRLAAGGFAPDAIVHCEPGVYVAEPPATFECPTTSAGKRYRLVVTIEDPSGAVQWKAVPQ
jgi:hypothetical protein